MATWKKIKENLVHKNPWFSIYADDVLKPNKEKGKYYHIKTKHAGVVILPFDGKHIYLINQYRYTLKRKNWELPAGAADKGKSLLLNAKRELKEETGLNARKWTYLGKFAAAPGESDLIGHAYLAENLSQGSNLLEAGESDLVVKKFTPEQIYQLIQEGKIIDAWALVPLYLFSMIKT
jgi:ADP-ribose pyrophosphatase